MKHTKALLLLLLTLLIAVQPVMALHFCGKSLASVEFYKAEISTSCCCNDNVEYSSTSAETINNRSSCCSMTYLAVSTDEFLMQDGSAPYSAKFAFVFPVAMASNSLLPILNSADEEHLYKELPFRMHQTGRDILSRICILTL